MRFPRLAPREVPLTGDPRPVKHLWGYIARMAGPHQLGLCLLAVAVSALNLAPVELQRRIVDDAVTPGDKELLILLVALYAVVLTLHQVAKFSLRVYQSWVSESAIKHTRRHTLRVRQEQAQEHASEGAAMVLGNEVDKLGGFVGEGLSNAAANISMLVGGLAYMFYVEPEIAAFAMAFLIPQILLTPLLQRKLNELVERRVRLIRGLGEAVRDETLSFDQQIASLSDIYRNRLNFFMLKFALKGMLNLMSGLAPLTVLAVGGWMAVQGQTTVGVLVAFISGFERLAEPLRQMIAFYRQWAQSEVQHEMVADWMLPNGRPPPDPEAQARAAAVEAERDEDLRGDD
jgi:ABC-type bacteriocin/lantibiotic exporter with double-glycine peptidase domain